MVNEINAEIKDYFQQVCGVQGIDGASAAIISELFIEPEPIPMDQVAERTGYSLASICNKIKIFENIGFIKRSRKPGSKTDN